MRVARLIARDETCRYTACRRYDTAAPMRDQRALAPHVQQHIEDARAHGEPGERDPQRLKDLAARNARSSASAQRLPPWPPVPTRRGASRSCVASRISEVVAASRHCLVTASGSYSTASTKYGHGLTTISSVSGRTRSSSSSRTEPRVTRLELGRAWKPLVARSGDTRVAMTSSMRMSARCCPFIHSSFFGSNTAAFFCRPSTRSGRSVRSASSLPCRRPATSRAARGS
jgi:hypothetical protein